MIFVTVGSQKFQFNRVFQLLDEAVESGVVQDELFAQIGNSDYIPKNFRYKRFLNKSEFEYQIQTCALLITHGGVATIITGLKNKKPVIVIPRLSKYKEHVDDHQVQIAESFENQNFVAMYREGNCIDGLIQKAKNHNFAAYCSQRNVVVDTIKEYLSFVEERKDGIKKHHKVK